MSNVSHTLLAALSILLAATLAASAATFACEQDCSSGACLQAACAPSVAGAGFCECSNGALPWGDTTFAAYCSAWGQPGPGCPQAAQGANAIPPSMQLANAATMTATLAAQNPYVATLLQAMTSGGSWPGGPVQGLLHDSHYDATAGRLSHTAALAFAGQVTMTGAGVVQVDVNLTGDLTQLTWLKQYSAALATEVVAPQTIHGTVSAGGLHGSLLVLGTGGQSQTIQW